MAWSFYINSREVTPYNPNSLKISEFMESKFRVRVKMEGDIILKDSDYAYLKDIEANQKYERHEFTAYYNSELRYTGVFTVFNIKFNDYQKIAYLTTEANDKYSLFHERKSVEINVLKGVPKYIESRVKSYLAFTCYQWVYFGAGREDPPLPEYELVYDPNDPLDTGTLTLMEGYIEYASYYSGTSGMPTKNKIIAQERVVVDKDRDMALWTFLDDYGDSKLYGRTPVAYDLPTLRNYADNEDLIKSNDEEIDGYYNIGVIRYPNYDEEAQEWTYEFPQVTPTYFHVKKDIYNGGQYIASLTNKHRSWNLKDVISTIIKVAVPEFTGEIKSSLLFNDELVSEIILDSQFDLLKTYQRFLIEKSDYKFPAYSSSYWRQASTSSLTTFSKMIDSICKIYNADWFIDSSGNFRIEHISSGNTKESVDLSNNPVEVDSYSYMSNGIPNRVLFEFSEHWTPDFGDQELKYGNIPALAGSSEQIETISIDHITTDVDGANLFLHKLSPEGFILVETKDDEIIKRYSHYSEYSYQQNAELSLANIIYNYYRHEMFKPTAKFLREKDLISLTLKKLKQQEGVNAILSNKPDISKGINTNIGVGEIQSIEYTCNEDNTYVMNIVYD